jgi:ferric-dicitrate binding protein FerR (iron transport regulator)
MTDPTNSPPEQLAPDPAVAEWLGAHRAPGEPEIDIDDAWARFEARHGQPQSVTVVPLWRRPVFFGGLAAALAAVLAIVALRLISTSPSDRSLDMIQVVAANGRPKIITLDDGSRIMLHGGSTFRYPSRGSDRYVYLDGEALFEITHDPDRAFRVHASHGVVDDLGTTFTVRAYSGESSVQVAVTEGHVTFARDSQPGPPLKLSAGEAAVLDSTGTISRLPPSAVERLWGWTTGAMVFDNVELSVAAAEIEHGYGVRVIIADSALARRPVVARFNGEPVKQVLDAIVLALDAHYDVSGTTYTLRPGRN